jgi:hypothetical protein
MCRMNAKPIGFFYRGEAGTWQYRPVVPHRSWSIKFVTGSAGQTFETTGALPRVVSLSELESVVEQLGRHRWDIRHTVEFE